MENDLMLRIEDLHVFYGGIHALKGINIEVPAGKIVALVGANGAGKSTTLRTVSGLVRARQGKIEFQGIDITRESAHHIVEMGLAMVPEGRRIFPNLTVWENLLLGSYTRRDKEEIKEDLDWIFRIFPRLKERVRQKGGTLSGGEQQMLAVARALMSRPHLLMMDEPSLGLAPLLVKEIFNIIREINQNGTTILLIEQNAKAALQIAHYAYVLETGSVVLEGRGKELLENEKVRKAYLGEE
ncbi:MAG: ABC transporter ATP-binding protein [Atribacterota bacterium]|jgi:branched-chain amino acid transport system ATP-binding protein|nr:ABC transporter ATP-binding protein [Atribacterota bacterium]HOA98651.1 ABC transporter ATP-binding protein [Candidatus Atribacteria bacterium]MDI9608013.1 ABC transporter ATP-binding protein [Atribacterota bacterium]MDY0134934.1 ABC transporter ATP-binding protein [Atribacterota bacterium]HOQ51359.1 ABC transporter ATP-binding protein [Candidatus Atribacteria bacterium]